MKEDQEEIVTKSSYSLEINLITEEEGGPGLVPPVILPVILGQGEDLKELLETALTQVPHLLAKYNLEK